MTLYLIAHKVRGEPAFDIALRFDAVPDRYDEKGRVLPYMDIFDDEEGAPWWVVPTSGRRAYPYWWCEMWKLGYVLKPDGSVPSLIQPMPTPWPDHYPPEPSPQNWAERLGLIKPKAKETGPVRRPT